MKKSLTFILACLAVSIIIAPFQVFAKETEALAEAEKNGSLKIDMLSDIWQFKADGNKNWTDNKISGIGWGMPGFSNYTGWATCQQKLSILKDIMEKKHCYLFFPAVDEEAEVYINNKKAFEHTVKNTGIAPGLLWDTPFIVDVKPFLKPEGEVFLKLRIFALSSSGGIRKPVFLIGSDEKLDVISVYDFIAAKKFLTINGKLHKDPLKEIKRDYELADSKPLPPSPKEEMFGGRIQRTMTIIATSSSMLRRRVKILFYGQSITAGLHWTQMINTLRKRHPWSIIEAKNRAIGGFKAPTLVRVAAHDLYSFYPDLVVFHVYGGQKSGELERIIYNIRKYTTSEILTWTHHVVSPGKGKENDALTKRSDTWYDKSAQYQRYLAQKYDCELVEVRKDWKNYLKTYKIPRNELMGDKVRANVHPNLEGHAILAKMLLRHFRFNSLMPNTWVEKIRTYEARRFLDEKQDEITFTGTPWKWDYTGVIGTSPKSALKLKFHGNRIDVVPMYCSCIGTARVLIDGKAPSEFPGVYTCTRPSKSPGCRYPALLRVSTGKNPVAEDWTMTVTDLDMKNKSFKFKVKGSITGEDGSGSSDGPFVSKSGRISIARKKDYFVMFGALKYRKDGKAVDAPFDIKWKTVAQCSDIWKVPCGAKGVDLRIPLAVGLENGSHTIEIIPNGDGNVPIKALVVYRPGL
jgi:hypothetical protein